jgi:2-polyprenyl-3-methyl-5-hydroxy-6-metoxy-1,4-benzoquinol methylase
MMSRDASFWDRHAEGYSKRPVSDEAVYQEKLRVTREYFRPDMEVLEFGSGTGSTAIAHAPYVKHIRATDISSKMIEIAQGKARAANVLHLLEDKEDIIDRVYQMLKPGGVYVTSTPCLGDNMRFFKFVGPIGRFLRLLPLIRVFTRKQLEDSITNAGFEIDHSWQPGKGKAVFIVATKSS